MSNLLLLLISYLAIAAWFFVVQRSYIYFPDTNTPNPAFYQADFMQVIEVQTEDGLALKGWYTAPAPGKPVIVHFHGNGGNIGIRAPFMAPYVRKGYGVLLAEYRGYGGNSGNPSEKGLYKDARAYINWLINRMNIEEKDIVLYGESLGTGVAVKMALEHPEAAALILEAPYTSLAALSQKHMFFLPAYILILDRYNSLKRIGSVKTPLLVLHGRLDKIVPYRFGEKLYNKAVQPKTMESFSMGNHLNLYQLGAASKVIAFLQSLDQVKMSAQ